MIVPAAMFIEAATEQITQVGVPQLQAQEKELHVALGNQSEEFVAGYQLGIQTARVLLSGMPAAVFNKVVI